MTRFLRPLLALWSLLGFFRIFSPSLRCVNSFGSIHLILALVALPQSGLAESVDSFVSKLPQVYVSSLKLNKNSFEAGSIASGSFMLVNIRDIAVPDAFYRISVVGELAESGVSRRNFGYKEHGPVFIEANEKKLVSFEHSLPSALNEGGLGIEIQAFQRSGFPMGWASTPISVFGGAGFVRTEKAIIGIDDKEYKLQEGPTIKGDKVARLRVWLNNPLQVRVSLYPGIRFHRMTIFNPVIKTESLKHLEIDPGQTILIEKDLPNFGREPGVYAGEFLLTDETGNTRNEAIEFRYIVPGKLVTLRGIASKKSRVKKGEALNFEVLFSGAAPDIDDHSAPPPKDVCELKVLIYNEKNELIGDANESFDVNSINYKQFKFRSLANAAAIRAEVFMLRDGKEVANYKAELSSNFKDAQFEEGKTKAIYYLLFTAACLVIALLTTMALTSKRKRQLFVIVIFSCRLLLFDVEAHAQAHLCDNAASLPLGWNVVYKSSSGALFFIHYVPGGPVGPLEVGEKFYLTGSFSLYLGCGNAAFGEARVSYAGKTIEHKGDGKLAMGPFNVVPGANKQGVAVILILNSGDVVVGGCQVFSVNQPTPTPTPAPPTPTPKSTPRAVVLKD